MVLDVMIPIMKKKDSIILMHMCAGQKIEICRLSCLASNGLSGNLFLVMDAYRDIFPYHFYIPDTLGHADIRGE